MKGGQRQGAGRKPGSPNKEKKPGKDAFLHIRCLPEEKMKIQELAKLAGLPVSGFVLNMARQAEASRIKAKTRAQLAGYPEWENACARCGCEIKAMDGDCCPQCERGLK